MDPGCDQALDLVHAELDGEISEEQRARLGAHLQRCEDCASLREDMAALVGAARRLPQQRLPQRDLWTSIRARIAQEAQPPQRGQTSIWGWSGLLALAAAALVGLSLTWQAPQRSVAPSAVSLEASAAAWEQEVRGATDELLAALEARRDDLDPETLEVVTRNLRIIDQAIEETRAVLAKQPQDEAGRAALAALHQHKLQLLRQVVDLPRSG